jgi:4-hydroxythreonine-4-phosphate dehydrogenase
MKIGMTMGDPAGVGPEIILKAIKDEPIEDFLIIGSISIIEETKARYSLSVDPAVINCVDISRVDIPYGKVSKTAGEAAYKSILCAVDLLKRREIDTLVTAPVNKESLMLGGCPFPGHTQLLASLADTKRFAMLFFSENLKVTLVTTHIPLKEIPETLTREKILEKIELTNEFFLKYLSCSPKIAICGLNPHAGENGLIGNEEINIISPAIRQAKSEGIDVEGPYPADTIFTRKGFDVFICMYHDQGLIPVKLLGRSVNVTIGLPFIRTSPDHGTAFDIAGKGIADYQSMRDAISVARMLVLGRKN